MSLPGGNQGIVRLVGFGLNTANIASPLRFPIAGYPVLSFASLTLGKLRLFINSPGAGGAGHAMPDGTMPSPGGWNRIQLQVKNIEAAVEDFKKRGATFRNEIVQGVGRKQILLQDPSRNLIELFEFPAQ